MATRDREGVALRLISERTLVSVLQYRREEPGVRFNSRTRLLMEPMSWQSALLFGDVRITLAFAGNASPMKDYAMNAGSTAPASTVNTLPDNGSPPGPTLRVRRGDAVVRSRANRLNNPTNI